MARKELLNNKGLEALEGKKLGKNYLLRVKMRPRRYFEQKYFEVFILDEEGHESNIPVFSGIYSKGRESIGIKGWVDGDFYEEVEFSCGGVLNLSKGEFGEDFFRILGDIIPDGGSFMVSYELFSREGWVHKLTNRGLFLGVPPIATPLGYLLFKAGCGVGFKDWYISEGGNEGPRKLQGFKAVDKGHLLKGLKRNLEGVEKFLDSGLDLETYPFLGEIIEIGRKVSIEIKKMLSGGL